MNIVKLLVLTNKINNLHLRFINILSVDKLLCDSSKLKCIKSFEKLPTINLAKDQPKKNAAILIPVCVFNNSVHLLYTLRSAQLSSHVRQVSFPGGYMDKTDKDITECALRETKEEIGLPKIMIEIWGKGPKIISFWGPTITPIIGLIRDYNPKLLTINHDEVEKVFTVPIETLCSNHCTRFTQFRSKRTGYSIPTFISGEERIWGITAVITNLFLKSFIPDNLYIHKIKYLKQYN